MMNGAPWQKPSGRPFGIIPEQAPRGLFLCFPFADPSYSELLYGLKPSTKTTPKLQATNYGPGLTFTGTGVLKYSRAFTWAATQKFSMEWFGYVGALPAGTVDLMQIQNTTNGALGWIGYDSSGLLFAANAFNTEIQGPLLTANSFNSIILTYDGAGNLNLYVNGKAPTTGNPATNVTNPNEFAFGNTGDAAPTTFTCLLANFAMVNWSASEIRSRYLNPFGFLFYGESLFGTTYAAVQSPFFVPDLLSPIRIRDNPELRTWVQDNLIDLIGQDNFFGASGQTPAYDYPNPRASTATISLRTHSDNSKIQLIGQDRIYNGPGQTPSFDSPNPRIRPSDRQNSWWINLLESTLGIIVSPFYLLDWPNPRRNPNTTPAHVDASKIYLIGQDQFFAGPGQTPAYDYPLPRRNLDYTSQQTWWQNLLNSVLGIPNKVFDWFVPRRNENISLRSYTKASDTQLIGQDQIYGALGEVTSYDNQNPTRRKDSIENRSWIQNLLENTLTIIVFPFSFLDWQNPFGPKNDNKLNRTHIDETKIQLINQDQFYNGPGQVPAFDNSNPIRRKADASFWTWTQSLLQNTLSVVFPFSFLGWTNPLTKPPIVHRGDNSLNINLIGQDKIYGAPGEVSAFDNQNPVRRRLDGSLWSWTQNLLQNTLAAIFPLSWFGWTNPIIPKPTIHRSDNSLNVNLIGQDQFFGAPGETKTYDYTNPVLRKNEVTNRTWLQNIIQAATFIGIPFAQTEWTNPRRAIIRAFDWVQSLFAPPTIEPTERFTFVLEKFNYARVSRKLIYTVVVSAMAYVSVAQEVYGMPFFGALPPVATSQKQTIALDFGNFLPSGVVLSGTPTLNLSVASGIDRAPNSRVSSGPNVGTASISVGGTGLTNTAILFQVYQCVSNVQYVAEVSCSRTDGDIVEGSATFWCNPPGKA